MRALHVCIFSGFSDLKYEAELQNRGSIVAISVHITRFKTCSCLLPCFNIIFHIYGMV